MLFDESQMDKGQMEIMAGRIDGCFLNVKAAEEQAIADARQGTLAEPPTRGTLSSTGGAACGPSRANSGTQGRPSIDAIVGLVESAVLDVGLRRGLDANVDELPPAAVTRRLVEIVVLATGEHRLPMGIFPLVQNLARAVQLGQTGDVEGDFERVLTKGMARLMGAG
jgi:hypothetical protein